MLMILAMKVDGVFMQLLILDAFGFGTVFPRLYDSRILMAIQARCVDLRGQQGGASNHTSASLLSMCGVNAYPSR